jgi:hypothetical protein
MGPGGEGWRTRFSYNTLNLCRLFLLQTHTYPFA